MHAESVVVKPSSSIATQVFIGLGMGILAGVFFGERVAFLKIGGDIFIALLQITVIPYVMVALITSLGRLTLADARALGLKGGSILLVLWAIGLVVVLISPLAFPDWPSASFFSTSQIEETKPVDFLQLYIPSNIFFSLSNAVVPAIVVFSVLFGLALTGVPNKEKVLDVLSPVGDGLMKITGYIARLTPYGVFAISASAAGTIEIADLGRLQVYIVTHATMALILSLWVIPGLIAVLTPLRFMDILRAFRGPMITAFATGSVLIVLPILVADSKMLIAQAAKPDTESATGDGSLVDVLIPAAFPFPSLGANLALIFVLFGGWYIGILVPVSQYAALAGAGVASMFGGTVLSLPFLFDMLRLPADLFRVFVTVDVIGSRFGTLLAAMHFIGIALIGSYAMQGVLRLRLVPLLRFTAISVVLIASAVIAIRAFYTYIYVEPYTKDRLLTSLHRIEESQPGKVYREAPQDILGESEPPLTLAGIRRRGILRTCYVLNDYPSAFFNKQEELVGFDIELAHQLARQLDLKLDFLPVRSVREGMQRVNTRYCDVFMSLTPIVPELSVIASMTPPVRNVPVGLVVRDYRREQFATWADVRKMSNFRILMADTPTVADFLERILPDAVPVIYHDMQELDLQLDAGLPDADAVLAAAEEGAAWTILHPQFNLVTPMPNLLIPFGYAVARDNSDLLLYLNAWLLDVAGDGTVDELYRYWILGEIAKTQPPRWSIIHDALGWVD